MNNVVKTAHIVHDAHTIDVVNNVVNCMQSIHISDRDGFLKADLIRNTFATVVNSPKGNFTYDHDSMSRYLQKEFQCQKNKNCPIFKKL